jgi:16S rRNA (cytosine1402-N4)-methyltransferase
LSDVNFPGFYHEPVLLREVSDYLLSNKDSTEAKVYVDCTLGGGGYTRKILEITKDVKVVALDRDVFAIEYCKKVLSEFSGRIIFVQGNFGDIKNILNDEGYKKISGITMDLGLSTYQLSNEDGFSYQRDTALDMRADKNQKLTAKDILNTYSEKELARILYEFGELRYSRKIAKLITEQRKKKKFNTTFDLVELLKPIVPVRFLNGDLSKLFQAIRIELNNELENLTRVLEDSIDFLEHGARIATVSYHSLEDRIVKNSFRNCEKLKIITKKPVESTKDEVKNNAKARSAKLRVAEKI